MCWIGFWSFSLPPPCCLPETSICYLKTGLQSIDRKRIFMNKLCIFFSSYNIKDASKVHASYLYVTTYVVHCKCILISFAEIIKSLHLLIWVFRIDSRRPLLTEQNQLNCISSEASIEYKSRKNAAFEESHCKYNDVFMISSVCIFHIYKSTNEEKMELKILCKKKSLKKKREIKSFQSFFLRVVSSIHAHRTNVDSFRFWANNAFTCSTLSFVHIFYFSIGKMDAPKQHMIQSDVHLIIIIIKIHLDLDFAVWWNVHSMYVVCCVS